MRQRYAIFDDRGRSGPGLLAALLMALATVIAIGLVGAATIGVA